MNAINIYELTRIQDVKIFDSYEQMLSGRASKLSTKQHEKDSLSSFVNALVQQNIYMHELSFFFFSFTIPQISKEFDLLKISKTHVLNIELKSEMVETDKIKAQLQKNRYYLQHMARESLLFTYISGSGTVYELLPNNILVESSIDRIIELIRNQSDYFQGDINELFRVSDFLSFTNKRYYEVS